MSLAATMAAVALAMPAPSPMPTIHERTACPDIPHAIGCYYPGGDVYLRLDSEWTRQHELAHAVDHLHVNDGEQARIRKVLAWPRWRLEAFADIYAGCRLGLNPLDPAHRTNMLFHGIKAKRVPGVCRLFARASR